ncbi:MAG: IS3 family transposase [Deltaproteobacteria bacterium]|nr:IS3 family transposase [Deltaproteobacteria bacterium]
MEGLAFLIPLVGIAAACVALGVSRATYYRAQKPKPDPKPRPKPARALTDEEQAHVLATLNSDLFVDKAPAQVYAKLLEDGEYLCSERTMYRILAAHELVRERRAQRRHPEYKKPQLVATAPNQVWSWDTTKLPGPTKGTYFTLYVILDIFSRYIVGWQVTKSESAAVAQELIDACCKQQGVARGQLTIHADRGSPMVAKSTAQLYVDLGVAKSHSRPHTSNDNPYSESNFRTLKYRPDMPSQLGSLEHARQVVRALVDWYNDDHYHVGLALLHPVDVHYGRVTDIVAARQRVLDAAQARHPERFVGGRPVQKSPPSAAWINPPPMEPIAITSADRIEEVAAH